MLDHMDLAVERHLVDRVGVAQELGLKVLDIIEQRLVGTNRMRAGVTLEQDVGQLVVGDQLRDLGTGLVGIGAEVFEGLHGANSTTKQNRSQTTFALQPGSDHFFPLLSLLWNQGQTTPFRQLHSTSLDVVNSERQKWSGKVV